MMRILEIAMVIAIAGLSTGCEKEEPPATEPVEAEQAEAEPKDPEHEEHAGHDGPMDHANMNHEMLPAAEVDPGASLYQLDVELVSHDGEPFGWDDMKGKPVVTSMVYSSCTTACPLIVQEIKNILESAGAKDHSVVLFSMDPERDTPEALAKMKKGHKLDDNWTLVRPGETDVREIAAALGIRYRLLPSGDFNHSQLITLLSENGTPVARAEGLGPQRASVVKAIEAHRQK